jgi:hypothetical protein
MDDPIQFPASLALQIIRDRLRWANKEQIAAALNIFYPEAAAIVLKFSPPDDEEFHSICVYPGAIERLLISIPE